MIDFKEQRVSVCGYSIRSSNYGKGDHHPRAFRFDGSNDKTKWEAIDSRNVGDDLNGPMVSRKYECKQSLPFRYIRLMLTERNCGNCWYLMFSQIEFFGFLKHE
jgi:hypothetical protein